MHIEVRTCRKEAQRVCASIVDRAAASAGQSGLMALYDTLFAMMDLQASQLLVTPRDFRDENFKINLRETTEELLSVSRVIPVFNENDAKLSPCVIEF
jgi:glutamate 5-kinase